MRMLIILLASLLTVTSGILAQIDTSPQDVSGAPGDSVQVPIVLSNPEGIAVDAFGLKFHFPSSLLSFVDVVKEGTLTANWMQISGKEIADGVINIGGFHTTAVTGSGVLFEVRFTVKEGASGAGTLHLTDFVDDLGCSATTDATFTVEIISAPVADFSASPLLGLAPLEVKFTDLSSGDITSWSWEFGDGDSSLEQNPSHIFVMAEMYSVSLTVTGPGGSDTKTKANYITVINDYDLEVSPTDVIGTPNSSVRVPVIINNRIGVPLHAFGLKFHFPSSLLGYTKVVKEGTLTADWIEVNGREITEGVIIIGGFDTTAVTGSGVLFEVEFTVQEGASGTGDLQLTNFVDDITWAMTNDATIKINHPPQAPRLRFPQNDTTIIDWPDSLKFVWYKSMDPDSGDIIKYDLIFSNDSTFIVNPLNTIVIDDIEDTSYTVDYPLNWCDGCYYWTVTAHDQHGLEIASDEIRAIHVATHVHESNNQIPPTQFLLLQNYPNPFNTTTVIEYFLPSPADVQIEIFDISGRSVKSLLNENKSAGSHVVKWDGCNEEHILVPGGVYIYRINAGAFCDSKTMVFLK